MGYLSDFVIVRPRFESPQSETLEWIAAAHASASVSGASARGQHLRLLQRYGCANGAIAARGHELEGHRYAQGDACTPGGSGAMGMAERMDLFRDAVASVMETLIPPDVAPDHVLHVTCTGYRAPNGAQECVARRGWGTRTTVTPVYHSGCYAALPALRIATALLDASRSAGHVRIVHTEFCTLHLNPRLDNADQLVVQTLFSDGSVSLRVTGRPPAEPSLEVLALREEILPDSADCMTWTPTEWGFAMTLARDVPERIGGVLPDTLARLCADAGIDAARVREEAVHAIHPGGPRILDLLQDRLGLEDAQLAASRDVLRRHGNMSSSTLPHVWAGLVHEPPGRLVVTCAFGPGLTVSTGLFRVHSAAS